MRMPIRTARHRSYGEQLRLTHDEEENDQQPNTSIFADGIGELLDQAGVLFAEEEQIVVGIWGRPQLGVVR
jgi:hypothetical protein